VARLRILGVFDARHRAAHRILGVSRALYRTADVFGSVFRTFSPRRTAMLNKSWKATWLTYVMATSGSFFSSPGAWR
jgi:ABC-type phosphate/phosphonate transport system permease subunit